jgi:hypothetical protein
VEGVPPCPLCQRQVEHLSSHHLLPRSRGGAQHATVRICPDCHDAIHEMFSNKQLENEYRSVEFLLRDERFSRHVRWLAKQDPTRRFPSRRAHDQRRRGRNG